MNRNQFGRWCSKSFGKKKTTRSNEYDEGRAPSHIACYHFFLIDRRIQVRSFSSLKKDWTLSLVL
jgi:hypothetical protein